MPRSILESLFRLRGAARIPRKLRANAARRLLGALRKARFCFCVSPLAMVARYDSKICLSHATNFRAGHPQIQFTSAVKIAKGPGGNTYIFHTVPQIYDKGAMG